MWVIIVNAGIGGAAAAEETREAAEFHALVSSALNNGSRDVRIDARSLDELAPLLFAPRWGYNDEKALLAFDHIDIIFFRGSMSVLPWYKTARQALLLMQQCIVCHTPTFACGFGAQLANYCLISDGLVTNVVNGYGSGSTLQDIVLTPEPAPTKFDHDIRSFDMFLDDATGDLFSFHRGMHGWLPQVNCGMRRWNLRPDNPGRATVSLTYKADVRSIQATSAVAFSSGLDDIVVSTSYRWNSPVMQLLRGDKDFKVEAKSKWRFNTDLLETKLGAAVYRVLATHEVRGAMIFELEDLFACNFAVKPSYPVTAVILRGFIDSKVKLLESQQSGRSGIAGTTLKGQTYLNMQLTEPEPDVVAAFGSLRLSADELDSAASTPKGPPPLFTPSALLLRVCPELRTWTVPEALVRKQASPPKKKTFARWAGVKEKIREIARAAIRAAPRPKPKSTATDIIQAFKSAADTKIKWSEAAPSGEAAASSVGRWKTMTVHRSDKLFVPLPDAGSEALNLKLSYTRRTGLESGAMRSPSKTAERSASPMISPSATVLRSDSSASPVRVKVTPTGGMTRPVSSPAMTMKSPLGALRSSPAARSHRSPARILPIDVTVGSEPLFDVDTRPETPCDD